VADFPPRRPRFDPRSGHMGFRVGKVTLQQGFPPELRFPLPILITAIAPHSSFGAGTRAD
jgi:hypothetical protein